MKKYDVVKLTNLKDYSKQNNLYLDVQGIVLEYGDETSKILFFNQYNQGDYAYLEVENKDIEIVYNGASLAFENYMKDNLHNFIPKEKGFKKKEFEAYNQVELLVEDERYSQYGVHKGDIGTIMEDVAVKDHILVDFGRLENNNYYGDCLSVNLKDVKVLKQKKWLKSEIEKSKQID